MYRVHTQFSHCWVVYFGINPGVEGISPQAALVVKYLLRLNVIKLHLDAIKLQINAAAAFTFKNRFFTHISSAIPVLKLCASKAPTQIDAC